MPQDFGNQIEYVRPDRPEPESVEGRVARLRRDYETQLSECRDIIAARDNHIEALQQKLNTVFKICEDKSENYQQRATVDPSRMGQGIGSLRV